MLDKLLGKAKDDEMIVTEIITDKDTSVNGIFCRHYPEGMVTYCSNHCAKTLHKKDLEKILILPKWSLFLGTVTYTFLSSGSVSLKCTFPPMKSENANSVASEVALWKAQSK